MPNPAQVAQLYVNNVIYSAWNSVNVTRTSGQPVGTFEFTATEDKQGRAAVQAVAQQIKVGDAVQVVLAGHKVIDGFVMTRQAALSAEDHTVALQGASKTIDIVQSSTKPAEYKGSTFSQIANALVAPFSGVSFKMQGDDGGMGKPLQTFRTQYGETAFEALERLGRMRGVMFCDDVDGNLVGYQLTANGSGSIGTPGGGADLAEGKNILMIRSTLSDINVMQKVKAVTQRTGSDGAYAGSVSKTAAVATNTSARPGRELYLVAEHTGTGDDAQARVDHEVARQYFSSVDVQVHVQGWLRPDGTLWKESTDNSTVSVYSPSTFTEPDGLMTLAVRQVTFLQDDVGGTKTVLDLCLPIALSNIPNVGPQGTVPDLLGQGSASIAPLLSNFADA